MNRLISINGVVLAVIIFLLAALAIGCCLLLLLLQMSADKNKWLSRKNKSLMERLSDKEFELYLTRNGLWKE